MTRVNAALAEVVSGRDVREALADMLADAPRAIRKARGELKLQTVAKALGYSKPCLGHFEAGAFEKVSESRLHIILAKYAAMELETLI